jgi:hypothetical protein
LSGKVATQRLVELTTTEEHGEFYEDGGEFLPVGVWVARGFDGQNIINKTLPKNIRLHPVLGETYRVCTLRKGHRGAKTVSKSDKLGAAGSMPGSSDGQLALEATPAQLALADKSSNSDSDSSSSSHHKKSKKAAKKAKKARKAEKKLKRKRSASPKKASLSSSCFGGSSIIKRPSR